MSKAIAAPRLHHFVPQCYNRHFNVKGPMYGGPTTINEYRKLTLPLGATEYQFGTNHPCRVEDIFLERADGSLIQNRIGQRKEVDGGNEWPHDNYTYDPVANKLLLKAPSASALTLHWFDPRKARTWNDQWQELAVGRLIQGADYVDEDLIPPPGVPMNIRFQGGYRCYLEIVAMPKHGVVKLTDSLDGFLYRGRLGFIGRDSFEYRYYNSLGQESDVACVTVQQNA